MFLTTVNKVCVYYLFGERCGLNDEVLIAFDLFDLFGTFGHQTKCV